MSDIQQKTLREILTETIDLRGLTIERLAELTNIPERYLTALRDGDLKRLPPGPYVRGYLMKIAEILEIDGRILWDVYKKQHPLRTSGIEDRLPRNRFALKRFKKKAVVWAIIIGLIVIYLIWQGKDFFGTPSIEIVNPVSDNAVVNSASIRLTGEVNPKDKLMVNNEEVLVEASGRFEKEFPLQPGVNTAEFKVKRFLGKETKVVRQIIYQPQ
ncbi:helix-turn-helix domain-containing protein [Candidatus Wolfebacteria bacterium]|nr:helix-turn-helix domain-containing protein [Candidatus Wolfebacteria bacterium]